MCEKSTPLNIACPNELQHAHEAFLASSPDISDTLTRQVIEFALRMEFYPGGWVGALGPDGTMQPLSKNEHAAWVEMFAQHSQADRETL